MNSFLDYMNSDKPHPFILLSIGFLTGVTAAFILLPNVIAYEVAYGDFRINWETLLAGAMGLTGGSFAFFAVIHQRHREEFQKKLGFKIQLKHAVGRIQLRADHFIKPQISSSLYDGFYDWDQSDDTSLNYVRKALEKLPENIPNEIITEELNEAHLSLRNLLTSYEYLFSQRHAVEKRNIEGCFLEISEHCEKYLSLLKR